MIRDFLITVFFARHDALSLVSSVKLETSTRGTRGEASRSQTKGDRRQSPCLHASNPNPQNIKNKMTNNNI